jgi:hypothetical protein
MEVTYADVKKVEVKHEGVTIKILLKEDLIEVTGNAMYVVDKTKDIDVVIVTRGFQLKLVRPAEFKVGKNKEVTMSVASTKWEKI